MDVGLIHVTLQLVMHYRQSGRQGSYALHPSWQEWRSFTVVSGLTSDSTSFCSTAPDMLHASTDAVSARYKSLPCSTGAGLRKKVKENAIWGGAVVRSYSSAAVLLLSSRWLSDRPRPAYTTRDGVH